MVPFLILHFVSVMTVKYNIIPILLNTLQYHPIQVIIYPEHSLTWTKIIIHGLAFFIKKPYPWLNKLSLNLIILMRTQIYSDNQIRSWASCWHTLFRLKFYLYLRKSQVRQNFGLLQSSPIKNFHPRKLIVSSSNAPKNGTNWVIDLKTLLS